MLASIVPIYLILWVVVSSVGFMVRDRTGMRYEAPEWHLRARKKLVTALVAVGSGVLLTACSASAPPAMTSHGTLAVYANASSGPNVQTAYPDITDGSKVTVTDDSGKVINTGTLSYNKTQTSVFLTEAAAKYGLTAADMAPDVAIYTFAVTVPAGEQRYGFTVGKHRKTIWVPLSQVENPVLTLGRLHTHLRRGRRR